MRVEEATGKKRKTVTLSYLPSDTPEHVARAHFAELGLSAANPLGRCSKCKVWNLCHHVYEDVETKERTSGSKLRSHARRVDGAMKHCGQLEAVATAQETA